VSYTNPYIGRPIDTLYGCPVKLTLTINGQDVDATDCIRHTHDGAGIDMARISSLMAQQEMIAAVRAECPYCTGK